MYPIINRSFSFDIRGDSIDFIILISSIIIVFFALVSLVRSTHLRTEVNQTLRSHHIPKGKMVYSDLNVPAKPFFSSRYQITGKPDYIIKKNHLYIPIEVKSGSSPTPRHNHVLQLATYCQLLEDTYGEFVSHGFLVYNNVRYTIAYDPKLRYELQSVIFSMRKALERNMAPRNHKDPGKCRFCSMRSYCSEKLI